MFGAVRLVRCWGRIGTKRRELVDEVASETAAGQALQVQA
jgi:predicted DNA-binding WGR domain protein